jgi:tryptophan synthase alpha chain
MAVTGRALGEGDADRVVQSVRARTDLPTYVGIGISTPEQARSAALVSDGVIVGSALVRVILDGGDSSDVERFIRSFRSALDDSVS